MKIDLITEITLLIERYPGKVSRHGLLFDDLTVEEMYKDGFCGPIEFQTKKGTETAELLAGPAGEFDGQRLGQFVYRLSDPETGDRFPGKIKRMSFKKKTVNI